MIGKTPRPVSAVGNNSMRYLPSLGCWVINTTQHTYHQPADQHPQPANQSAKASAKGLPFLSRSILRPSDSAAEVVRVYTFSEDLYDENRMTSISMRTTVTIQEELIILSLRFGTAQCTCGIITVLKIAPTLLLMSNIDTLLQGTCCDSTLVAFSAFG
jgi:hypothetical protein